jgi:hypothetical protein
LGDELPEQDSDDYIYTKDLGLIREYEGSVQPANPIYAELIIRALNFGTQKTIENKHEEYIVPRYIKDGRMDINYLLRDFQSYWRENSEIWKNRYKKDLYQYDHAAPHLVLQAFLQRVLNGGGRIIREMALGSGRLDLCVEFLGHKYPIELKILQSRQSYEKCLNQVAGYIDKVGVTEGWLVVFDRDTKKPWEKKIYENHEVVNGKKIGVFGA